MNTNHGEEEASKQNDQDNACECKKDDSTQENEEENLKDLLLRAHADVENMRKRMLKDREETIKFAITKFAKDILPVIDNLERALANMDGNEHCKAFVDGIELTKKELHSALSKNGITKIETKRSDAFDHNLHQIMCEVDSEDIEPGKIVDIYQSGFLINGRLLRPTLVGVAKRK